MASTPWPIRSANTRRAAAPSRGRAPGRRPVARRATLAEGGGAGDLGGGEGVGEGPANARARGGRQEESHPRKRDRVRAINKERTTQTSPPQSRWWRSGRSGTARR